MDVYSKFDLHIHSFSSKKKKTGDKTIVVNSTLENLNTLTDNLVRNQVNVVAITDHNIFDGNIYMELKKEELKHNCIHKVLPGIEVDLKIEGKIVHVVCIFDDSIVDHVLRIEKNFENKEFYTVDDLGSILRRIELPTVLIAHQKCDYISERPQKTSLSSVGLEYFYKFIGTEFFDALEIQNTKVEGILKSRFADDEITNFNLIVGSDCHDWVFYPSHHEGLIPSELLYMKALPTFQGLVMALTDYSRIFTNSETAKDNTLKKLTLELNGELVDVELSDKINVIIGDNSVGKSSLVKHICGEIERGATEFLNSHKLKILNNPLEKNHYTYSSQGKIRAMFESSEEKLPIKQKFSNYFIFIDKEKYKEKIKDVLKHYGRLWEQNEKITNNLLSLNRTICIPCFTDNDKHYMSVNLNLVKEENKYTDLVKSIENIVLDFKSLNSFSNLIENEDVEKLKKARNEIISVGKKYYLIKEDLEQENEIKSSFIYSAKLYNDDISKRSSSDESILREYKADYNRVINSILFDVENKINSPKCYWDSFKEFSTKNSPNQIGKYCFVDKFIKDTVFTKEIITSYISKFINISKPMEALTTSEILRSVKGKKNTVETAENLNQLLQLILNSFCEEYFATTVEIKKGNDNLKESNSAGINSLYYIDILSETHTKPIFIADQLEDDVSQSRISSDLIQSLKNLSKRSQIIMVTHNPQLVVNLDADNVIVLKKTEENINVYSGPLELNSNNLSIINLVADTLDGGAEVLRKRWKRYAK